jgi:hypothetical protein
MAFDPRTIVNKKKKENSIVKKLNITNKSKTTLGNINKEDVLNIVKLKGPVTPTEIKRELKKETYLISAVLSELVNTRTVKTTNVKKGTSIFYYIPSQEAKLEQMISYLNEKDQRTVHILKEKKVLQDKPQELLIRVSLRKVPDYAKPINIRISEDEVKLFWKYFLVSDEEAKQVIRSMLSPVFKKEEDNKYDKNKTINPPTKLNNTNNLLATQKTKPKQKIKERIIEQPKQIIKKNPIEQLKQELISKNNKPIKKQLKLEESQAILIGVPTKIEDKLYKDNNFLELKEKLKQKNIIIKEATSVRKGKEYDLVIIINTAIGKSRFFAKYKNKKRCNDADISTALVIGQSKNLPVAFITPGELTKKTKEQAKGLFKNVMIVEGF